MTTYTLPETTPAATTEPNVVHVVASGDLRPSANVTCWPVQRDFEADLEKAFTSLGWSTRRAHPFDEDEGHGFVKPENRMDAYGAIERFFAKHLGGRSES